ncbi:hypothetical protein [Pseudomonas brenneri]|uniref:hypothetical protein n=1 Tax=Pseudomonas brenneri TaxID=129817 RepID=UPI003B9FCEA0
MNESRRKEITEIISDVYALRERIEQVKGQEQEAFENLPESLQRSELGEEMEEVVNSLDSLDDDLENVIIALTEAKGEVW